jgi:hypothetical protein
MQRDESVSSYLRLEIISPLESHCSIEIGKFDKSIFISCAAGEQLVYRESLVTYTIEGFLWLLYLAVTALTFF